MEVFAYILCSSQNFVPLYLIITYEVVFLFLCLDSSSFICTFPTWPFICLIFAVTLGHIKKYGPLLNIFIHFIPLCWHWEKVVFSYLVQSLQDKNPCKVKISHCSSNSPKRSASIIKDEKRSLVVFLLSQTRIWRKNIIYTWFPDNCLLCSKSDIVAW